MVDILVQDVQRDWHGSFAVLPAQLSVEVRREEKLRQRHSAFGAALTHHPHTPGAHGVLRTQTPAGGD